MSCGVASVIGGKMGGDCVGAKGARIGRPSDGWSRALVTGLALFLHGVCLAQSADLEITKSDGSATAVPGEPIAYTISVINHGPDPVTGAIVTDVFPSSLLGVVWTCVGSAGATCTPTGAGDINDSVDLGVGASVTYSVSATVDAGATGSLTNTATVSPPAGVTDPIFANNSSTDVDALTPVSDLGIAKTDFSSVATPGTSISYTITVTNDGPSHVAGAQVLDIFPLELQGVTWSCSATPGSSCTSSGAGDINDSVNIRTGGAVTYSVSAFVSASATGTLSNTATVSAPVGVTDPGPNPNVATDVDILVPEAGLSVSKTNSATDVTAGLSTTYRIVVSNSGPSDAPNTVVSDLLPPDISSASWSCTASGGATCTPAGSGSINELVDLPVGSTVVFDLVATVDPCASGNLVNVVDVQPAPGVNDPDLSDNSAVDSDTILVSADVGVTVTDSPDPVLVCNLVRYTITVRNDGPSCATGVTVANVLPDGVSFVSTDGSCVASVGNINCTVGDVALGGQVSWQIVGLVDRSLKGAVTVEQTSLLATSPDPNSLNNSVSVSTEVKGRDPYLVTMTGAPRYLRIGSNLQAEYSIRVTSLCDPTVASSDVVVQSTLPEGLSLVGAEPAPVSVSEEGATFELPVVMGEERADFAIRAQLQPDVAPGAELTHEVTVVDGTGLGGRASVTLYVRPVPDTRGRLVTKVAVPRKTLASGELRSRVVVDNKSMVPAQEVEVVLVVPSLLPLLTAVPTPAFSVDLGGITELHWFFPSVKRKQVIRLSHLTPDDLFAGEILTFTAEASDSEGNFASQTRETTVRLPRAVRER